MSLLHITAVRPAGSCVLHIFQVFQFLQELSGPENNTGQRILGKNYWDTRLLADELWKTLEKGPAACHYDTPLDNIRGEKVYRRIIERLRMKYPKQKEDADKPEDPKLPEKPK